MHGRFRSVVFILNVRNKDQILKCVSMIHKQENLFIVFMSCLLSMVSQDRVSLSGRATGLLPTALAETPHRPVVDSGRSTQSTHTASQNPLGIPENSLEPSYQDNAVQEAATERLITQGPVSLTGWYIIKVEITNVGR